MIMRYILRHIAPIVALASVMACEREVDSPVDTPAASGGSHAYIVAPDGTRTDFDSYVGKFAWSDGDQIAIHLSDGTFYSTAVNAETGEFTCSTTSSKQRDAYAVYPATAADATNYGSPTLKVTLPAEYNISSDLASDFSPVPMIAVNKQGEDDLYFRHVGGLLRITCDRVPAETRFIAVTFDRNVAGTFTVMNPMSDHPTITEGGDSPRVVFRIAGDYLTHRTNGIVLNVPIPTGSVSAVNLAALDINRNLIKSSDRDLSLTIARGYGKKLACNVIPAFTDSMHFVVTASQDNSMTFKMPFPETSFNFPADLSIDWGDGEITDIEEGTSAKMGDALISHTYASEGDYTITLTAVADKREGPFIPEFGFFYSGNLGSFNHRMLKALPTPLLRMGGNDRTYKFSYCEKLESICGDLFSKNPQFVDFSFAFRGCSLLRDIPAELFSYTPNAASFANAFANAGLTCSIPENLFANAPRASNFQNVFAACRTLTGSIPEKLFANNPLASDFSGAFSECWELTGPIPAGLFAKCPNVTSFQNTFSSCKKLTGSIPAGLFANHRRVTRFDGTFSGCTQLSGSIPGQLFANNPEVTTFSGTFNACYSLSGPIPSDLFAHNTKVTSFNKVFAECKSLDGTVPSGLFANNPLVTDFSGAFRWSRISGIGAGLFSHNPEVTDFRETFYLCQSITDLPGDMFTGCRKVTCFAMAFCQCTSLKSIPSGLFSDCPEVTDFEAVFSGVGPLNTIPSDLFANNPKVTSFSRAFEYCSSASCTVPAGLFANNPLAVSFNRTFFECFYWSLAGDVFTNASVTPATRFASVGSRVNFSMCFYNFGQRSLSYSLAPELWTYTFPEGLPPYSSSCFNGATKMSNAGDIPSNWK